MLEEGIDIAIVAVPAHQAQDVIEKLASCGIKAILNYAPIAPQVPEDVRVRNIDPVAHATDDDVPPEVKGSRARELA